MRKDINKHRRLVAWICFEPHLTEPQLLKAIEILEHGYQTDSVSSLIAYVSKICGDYGIGAEIRKSLYGKFHELMSKEVDDLIDPWALVEADRQAQAIPFDSKLMPKAESPAAEVPKAPRQPPAATPSQPVVPAVTVVFVGFIKIIVEHISDQTEFFELLAAESKQKQKEVHPLIGRWSGNLAEYDWAHGLNEAVLAKLLQLVYAVLCELTGPIEADQVFHKAIAKCGQMPEAKQFPPTRFL